MECSINNQQDNIPVSEDMLSLLEKVLEAAAVVEGVEPGAEVSLTLVNDDVIRELNRTYRGVDAPTDVLSFAMEETSPGEPVYEDLSGGRMLGDIIISLPTARRQAEAYGCSLEKEIAFLAVHGFLHLLGYDHNSDDKEKKMRERQDAILTGLGLNR